MEHADTCIEAGAALPRELLQQVLKYAGVQGNGCANEQMVEWTLFQAALFFIYSVEWECKKRFYSEKSVKSLLQNLLDWRAF